MKQYNKDGKTIDEKKKVTIYDLNGDMYTKYPIKTELFENKQEALDQKRKRRIVRHRQSVNHDLKFVDPDKSARSSVN